MEPFRIKLEPQSPKKSDDLVNYNNYLKIDDVNGKLLDNLKSEYTNGINSFSIIKEEYDIPDDNHTIDEDLNDSDIENGSYSENINVCWPSKKHEQINSVQPHKLTFDVSNDVASNNSNLNDKVVDVDTMNNKENQNFSKRSTIKFRLYCLHCNETRDVLRSYEKNDCVKCKKPMVAQCLKCNKQYDKLASMRKHINICGDREKSFKCAQCYYRTSESKLLQQHKKRMHFEEKEVECSKCNKKFMNLILYRRHEKICGKNPGFNCTLCAYKSHDSYSLNRHLQCHEKYYRKTVQSIYSCQRHENICGENPNFSCTLCSYKTHRKDGLKCHLETHEKIYQKTVQNNEASAALDLLNDNRKHELYSGVSKFRASFQCYCSKCRENFDNNSNLNSCKCKNCETKLLMRCIKCKSLHHSIEAIRYHWQYICSPKTKFECSTCDYSTTNTKHLKIHIQRKHTTIDPEKFYKCSECSKSFKIKQDLYVHIRNYSCMSKKPHLLCDHCPFRTKTKSALINHIKSHFVAQTATHQQALILLGNKKHERFDCENCGKAFGHSSNLDCHKKVCKSKISAQN